ncbi:sigma-70 family RNA polymerase sigma factor [Myroides marinus]|uniref:RNA polymerase sigma factor n=1 Tax=Myroides marinus TaxID=703342 RepID=UPI002577C4BC|nr:sigma-70 family RNA polymerase sigma factor [Myroides marinus]MDM1350928.1 sigma-70 family RNA polymerase sigma factor [Myroides marinus]MDM1358135.1 sigma-70 family RNA polymerase sigma factor [Myroides marinus]
MTIEELKKKIDFIKKKADNEKLAHLAFTDLYQSYGKLIYSIINSQVTQMGLYDKDLVETIHTNTFIIMYEKMSTFSLPDDSKNDGYFKAWLSTIARNEFLKTRRTTNKIVKTVSDEELNQNILFISEAINDDLYESINYKLLHDALEQFSIRDREILLTIYNFYEEGKNTPTEVLDELCKIHNTTKMNIRKIKSRCEQKIIEYFEKHSTLKPIKNEK